MVYPSDQDADYTVVFVEHWAFKLEKLLKNT